MAPASGLGCGNKLMKIILRLSANGVGADHAELELEGVEPPIGRVLDKAKSPIQPAGVRPVARIRIAQLRIGWSKQTLADDRPFESVIQIGFLSRKNEKVVSQNLDRCIEK